VIIAVALRARLLHQRLLVQVPVLLNQAHQVKAHRQVKINDWKK
ncbi:hypothetical protein AAULR_07551, partial [Lacticaseibacillus rhamnosus MTCC 5462]